MREQLIEEMEMVNYIIDRCIKTKTYYTRMHITNIVGLVYAKCLHDHNMFLFSTPMMKTPTGFYNEIIFNNLRDFGAGTIKSKIDYFEIAEDPFRFAYIPYDISNVDRHPQIREALDEIIYHIKDASMLEVMDLVKSLPSFKSLTTKDKVCYTVDDATMDFAKPFKSIHQIRKEHDAILIEVEMTNENFRQEVMEKYKQRRSNKTMYLLRNSLGESFYSTFYTKQELTNFCQAQNLKVVRDFK